MISQIADFLKGLNFTDLGKNRKIREILSLQKFVSLRYIAYIDKGVTICLLLLHLLLSFLAEKYLDEADSTPNYGLTLLQLLTTDSADDVVRVAAAITFKNFVKKNWRIVCRYIKHNIFVFDNILLCAFFLKQEFNKVLCIFSISI